MREESHEAGIRLIVKLLEEKKWETLDTHGIKDSDFFADSAQVLTQLRKYVKNYSEFPDTSILESQVKSTCPGLHNFEFPKSIPLEPTLDFFFQKKDERDLNNLIKDIEDVKRKEGAKAACDLLREKSKDVGKRIISNDVVSYKETAEQRILDYNELKWVKSNVIESPWPTLNKWLSGGWDKSGRPHNIVGQSGAGKTWMSIVTALYAAFESDERVLLTVMENDEDSVNKRLDSYFARVPFSKRRKGNLEQRSFMEYVKAMKSLKDCKGDVFVDIGKRSVQHIADLADKYDVGLVVVDGAYLALPSQRGATTTESLTTLAYDFQTACQERDDMAWITSLQLNPNAAKEKDAKEQGNNIRHCKEFFITSATTITATADEEDRLAQRIKIAMGKDGEHGGEQSGSSHFYLNDNKIDMSFEEFDETQEDEELAKLV